MRKLAISLLFSAAACGADRDAVSYVNPLVIVTRESAIGYGGTMPFVSPPFAMTNWTPQTRQNKISITSYNYDDSTISGFIGTHQPAIWMGDYGYLTLMPQVGVLRTAPDGRKLAYLHSSERQARIIMQCSGAREETAIRVEMTASERCAMLRFQFPSILMTIASDLLQQHIQTLVDDNARWQTLIADDILWELAYAPSLGHPAKLSGREEAVRHATWFVGAVENFRFFDLKVYPLADPQGAVAEVKGEGLIKSTGRMYRQDYVVFLRAADGKIAFLREYFDPVRAAKALDTPILGLEFQ